MKFRDLVNIRDWTNNDFETVRNILITTWRDSYNFIPGKDLITHLKKHYNQDKIFDLIKNPDYKCVLAELEGKPVGLMKLHNNYLKDRFYISSLYILPGYQGIGIGKLLLEFAEKEASKFKYDRTWVGVMRDNREGLIWYKRHGFTFVEEKPFQMGTTKVLHLIGYKIIEPI